MKNLLLVITLILAFTLSSNAQLASTNVSSDYLSLDQETKDNSEMTKENERSTFINLQKKVVKMIQADIIYPVVAFDNNIEGKVLLAFTFDGEISKLEVIESLGAGCDKAAIKAMESFPKYYRALGGKKVQAIKVIIPFSFGFTF